MDLLVGHCGSPLSCGLSINTLHGTVTRPGILIKDSVRLCGEFSFSFSADKNYQGESRFKLYKRMVDKFAGQMGYVAKIDDKGHYANFELFKR